MTETFLARILGKRALSPYSTGPQPAFIVGLVRALLQIAPPFRATYRWGLVISSFVAITACLPSQPPAPVECQTATDCDDGNPCTEDLCDELQCVNAPQEGRTCKEAEDCFEGRCSAKGECLVLIAEGLDCDDGIPCTAHDVCSADGQCQGDWEGAVGKPCDDGHPCTDNSVCGEGGVCLTGQPIQGSTSCEELDPCTKGNVCVADGSCSSGELRALEKSECKTCSCDALWGISCEYPKVVECPCNLWGDVQFVESFPDLTIELVDSFPDLEVHVSPQTPNAPGLWREVSSFPDFTVQVVDSFADLKVRLTETPSNACPGE